MSYHPSYLLRDIMSKERITVTIDEELVKELDRAAEAQNQSRSNLVEAAVQTWRKVQLERTLIEGYKAMADEDLKVAEGNLVAGYEGLK
jgi:metal-responsive CopG/Arc/MetJ family transcriptional regulator